MPKKNYIQVGGSVVGHRCTGCTGCTESTESPESPKSTESTESPKLNFVKSLLSNIALESQVIFNPNTTNILAVQTALLNLQVNAWNDEAMKILTVKMSERLKEAALDDLYHTLLDIPRMTVRSDPGQRGGRSTRQRRSPTRQG